MFAPFTMLPTNLNGHLYWFPPTAVPFAFPHFPSPPPFTPPALSPTEPGDENADPRLVARPTPQYHCKQCDRVFKGAKELQDHCTKLHDRLHECVKCVKTFPSADKLELHIRKKHTVLPLKKRMSMEGNKQTNKTIYQCERCEKRYETYYNYREHVQKHDGKIFECNQCGKRLSGQSALSRHSKIHNKPHECAMCAERFSSAYDLDCHFSYYHSTFKRFRCQFCDRALYNYSGKLRHQRLCPERPIDVVKVD